MFLSADTGLGKDMHLVCAGTFRGGAARKGVELVVCLYAVLPVTQRDHPGLLPKSAWSHLIPGTYVNQRNIMYLVAFWAFRTAYSCVSLWPPQSDPRWSELIKVPLTPPEEGGERNRGKLRSLFQKWGKKNTATNLFNEILELGGSRNGNQALLRDQTWIFQGWGWRSGFLVVL